jgi:aspartate racemase
LKDLGIIGTGKNAATWYLKKCQELYQKEYGNVAKCPVKLMRIPFEPINAILPDQMEEAGRLMLPHLHKMDELDVSQFILANITLHEAIDLQRQNIKLNTPFISLRNVIANHWDSNIKKAMIVGSYYTMQSEYLPSLFDDFHIQFIKPNKTDSNAIDRLRTTYFESPEPKAAKILFETLKRNYPEVDCFIISCTEHALALDDYQSSFNSFNLSELQCKELLMNNK